MISIFFIFLVSTAFAGVVEWDRCGGVGTFQALRIDGCQGRVCFMNAGRPYLCEGDLRPSSPAPSLQLKVIASYMGIDTTIIDLELENSSVQPGFLYTIKFTVVPNDALTNQFIQISAIISHSDSGLEEICVRFNVLVEPMPTLN